MSIDDHQDSYKCIDCNHLKNEIHYNDVETSYHNL